MPDLRPNQGSHVCPIVLYIILHYTVPSPIGVACLLIDRSSTVPWALALSDGTICHHAWPQAEPPQAIGQYVEVYTKGTGSAECRTTATASQPASQAVTCSLNNVDTNK